MVAAHIFHRLPISARLFMKKASWGCCVLVFNSSSEPAVHPEISDLCAPGCFVSGCAHHVMQGGCCRHSECSHGL